ncbi:MAG: hypothetical protein AABY22_19780 [Nanoarchaeota archaeon]
MFIKIGGPDDGKIVSVVNEEELDEKSKKAVNEKLASEEKDKNTNRLEK